MNPRKTPSPPRGRDADEEVSALIETLHQTEQRLEQLTSGEVDTVADSHGRTFLLRRAQDQLRHSEAAKQAAILNALPAYIALLDTQGRIISVNEAWQRFGSGNVLHGPGYEVGLNYLEICDSAQGDDASELHQVAEGIRSVLAGGVKSFSIEYPCHSPTELLWFLLTVMPLADDRSLGAVVMHLNITERKRAEETLLRFGAAMDAIVDAIYLVDRSSMRFVHINDAACRLLNQTREKLLALEPWVALATSRAELERAYDTVIASGVAAEPLEMLRHRDDGSQVWVELRRHAQRSGDRWTIVTLVRDITERKRAEQALTRLVAIIEATPDMVATGDPNGHALYYNAAGLRMLGFEPGLDPSTVRILDTHPDWAAKLVAETGIPYAIEHGTWSGETALLRRDGREIPISQVIIAHKGPDGSVEYLSTIARDITERKRAEAELRLQSAALNAAADAIVITDRNGMIEWVNPAFTALTGYRAEEAIGKNQGELIKSGVHDQVFYQNLWDTILAGHTWQGEMTNRRKDRSVYIVDQTITSVKGARDETDHFIGIGRDLTERKTLEAQVRQASKMDAVGKLASGVAHDFNNLLTVILGFADLMAADVAMASEHETDLGEIIKAARRAEALTRQLLAFSRQQVLQTAPVDVNGLITGMTGMLGRLIGENIEVSLALAPNLSLALADRGQLEQVVMNLVVNARDAMPDGGSVTIETADVELENSSFHAETVMHGRYVMLAITDTGSGMTKETQRRLFEPFFTTKEAGKGTGLGLSTTYGIIKQSKGYIWVYSEPGRGTTFKVYLPCSNRELPLPAVNSVVTAPVKRPSETVLLTEDEAGVRQLAKRILENAGYRVLEAANGDEGERLFAQHSGSIDLLVTDVIMPGCGGPELLSRLHVQSPTLRVLYMSGYTEQSAATQTGIDRGIPFVQKPFTAAEFVRQVRKALDR
jgi:PAS domain S-box-containing protein